MLRIAICLYKMKLIEALAHVSATLVNTKNGLGLAYESWLYSQAIYIPVVLNHAYTV